MNKRLFIALELPEEIKQEIVRIQKQITRQSFFETRLIDPDQLHLTLVFLGDVSESAVPEIQNVLRLIKFSQFKACLANVGVFPNEHYLRIIWIELVATALNSLVQQISAAIQPFVSLEAREFLSHITIARIKRVIDRHSAISFIKSLKPTPLCFPIDRFVLIESKLSEHGSTYLDIEAFRL